MDHRWDEMLQAEHRRRMELSRYGSRRIESDADVERRDQLAEARRRVHLSPWEIGAAHWNQRDLYTRNSHIDDSGYGRGPSTHPDVGSYAYPRYDVRPPAHKLPEDGPSVYEREAWPWLNYYDRLSPMDEHDHSLWGRVRHGASRVAETISGRPHAAPSGWRPSDPTLHENVCEALAYHPELDASDIEVEVKDAEVTLNGTVRSRREKRLAERLAEQIRGIQDVHNRLKLRKDDDDLAFTAPIPAY